MQEYVYNPQELRFDVDFELPSLGYQKNNMLRSFLNWLWNGRSSGRDDSQDLDKVLPPEVMKGLEDFINRPQHTILTEAILDATPRYELEQVVFDHLALQLPKAYEEREAFILKEFNTSQQAVYLTKMLEDEVFNGGLNQYFANWGQAYAKILPALYDLIRERRFADWMRRVNQVYAAEYDQIRKYQDGSLEGFSKSYRDNPLKPLDEEFYQLCAPDTLRSKLNAYIHANRADFIRQN